MSMLLAKLDQNTLQVEAYDHRLRLPSKCEKSSTDVAAHPSYPPLHAYKSTRVRTREIRIDPMSPTVFEKKKNMAANH